MSCKNPWMFGAAVVRPKESFRSVNGRTPVPESEESRAWLQAEDLLIQSSSIDIFDNFLKHFARLILNSSSTRRLVIFISFRFSLNLYYIYIKNIPNCLVCWPGLQRLAALSGSSGNHPEFWGSGAGQLQSPHCCCCCCCWILYCKKSVFLFWCLTPQQELLQGG